MAPTGKIIEEAGERARDVHDAEAAWAAARAAWAAAEAAAEAAAASAARHEMCDLIRNHYPKVPL